MTSSAQDLSHWQQAFVAALAEPDTHLPGIESGHQQRLDVYRNNVWASLIAALEEAYPVTRQVLGERFFAALAHDHARQHLPDSPLMMDYGHGLADTLQVTLTTLAESGRATRDRLPFYAVDLAQLEVARREAYHAADARALVPTQLSQLAPEEVMALRFASHPAARLLHLEYCVLDIWQRHQQPQATLAGLDINQPQTLLVTRPAFDVQVLPLSVAGARLLEELIAGEALGDAAATLAEHYPEEDLGLLLAPLLSSGVFIALDSEH
ncbi:DNA-binding domain-containing protein [Cobetia sp. QF-1]|uniref:HvfC/BufC N-terminal domain-containing protein n=1 Tax=Cobetia sp. QF-1 TaxID=1969833 RepID=UPI000B53FA8E|nr:DNA-binding domain-containing protein [Cobetia sp. QF-1]